MKQNKRLGKIIDQFMKTTFKNSGEVARDNVEKHLKSLKSLPIADAVSGLTDYLKRIKNELNKTTLEIESTTPLTSANIRQITQAVKADYTVNEVRVTLNPELLGGIKIKIGDKVWDDTLSRKILQLSEENYD